MKMVGRAPEVVLKDAASYLEAHGWCQWTMEKAEGSVCLLGSIYAVTTGLGYGTDAESNAAIEAIALRLGADKDYDVAAWNDLSGRTKAEVLAMLRGER